MQMTTTAYGRFTTVLTSIIFALLLAPMARAQELSGDAPISPYVVQDLKIDVTAEDAVKARETAFAEALSQGYAIMLERLVPDATERAARPMPDAATLGRLLQDFATRNEQLGPKRYTATYELRFKPRAVQALLAMPIVAVPVPATEATVPAETESAEPVWSQPAEATTPPVKNPAPVTETVATTTDSNAVLVLPFFQPNGKPMLWSGVNPLREALQRANLRGTSLRVPLGDLADIQSFDETHALTFSPDELAALLQRYDVKQAVIAIAVPDGPVTGAPASYGAQIQSMNVMLYRATLDAPKPQFLQSFAVSPNGVPSASAFYGRAVDKIRVVVPGLMTRASEPSAPTLAETLAPTGAAPQATTTVSETGGPKTLHMVARFRTMQDWQQMRARLQVVGMILTTKVLTLKTEEARVDVTYNGSEEDLMKDMRARGLQITATQMSISNGTALPDGSSAGVLYELNLNPWTSVSQPVTP
jgi:hypothetical protein